jgi:Uncharacterized protein conserved in bacteria (DUF2213)
MPWSKSDLPPSVKNKKWTDAQVSVFVKTANAVLASSGNEGEAIATGIKQAEKTQEENTNAKQFPVIFYCRHMQPGICKYEKETVLVDTDAIKRMIPSAPGKPVYIDHQKVDLDNLKKDARGYLVESFYNELDGWAWFKFLAIDDEVHTAIAKGLSVSNAYIPTDWGPAGTKNNCPYDREVLNANYTHLAIVPNPRYEGARIFTTDEFKEYQELQKKQLAELQNSQSNLKKGITMFKLFKNSREEVTTIDSDTIVSLENGKEITIQEMINAVGAEKKNDQMVKCGDEEMPLKELINRYTKLAAKKNADGDKDGKKGGDDEDEKDEKENDEEDIGKKPEKKNKVKKNAEEGDVDDGRKGKQKDADESGHEDETDDEDKSEKGEKKNTADGKKRFDEMRNAHNKANPDTIIVETSLDKLARGKALFSCEAH